MISHQPSPVARCLQEMLLLLLLLPILDTATASSLTCYHGPDNETLQCECEEDLNNTELQQVQVISAWRSYFENIYTDVFR